MTNIQDDLINEAHFEYIQDKLKRFKPLDNEDREFLTIFNIKITDLRIKIKKEIIITDEFAKFISYLFGLTPEQFIKNLKGVLI